MPFYYDYTKEFTTNGTTQTLSTHLRALTVANQESATVVGLYANGRHGTAGGGVAMLIRPGAAGTGGTAVTENKRNPNSPAASTTFLDDATAITPGTGPITQVTVGFAQTGGNNGWVALEKDHGLKLLPNGGANGNAEVGTKAVGTSVPINIGIEWAEG